jgi:hypothetical protein
MKRILASGLGVAFLAGVVGCGSAGLDEGSPTGDLTPAVPLDPKMVDMTGRSFSDVGKNAKKAQDNKAAQEGTAGSPTGEPPAEKK